MRAPHIHTAIVISLFGLWVVVSCGQRAPPADSPGTPLAQVGEEVITAHDFGQFVADLPEWTESEAEGSARVRDHLQSMVDRRLILMEAERRGLAQSDRVREALVMALEQRVMREVEEREMTPEVRVGEAEVREAFTARGWNRRLKVAHIFVRTKEDAARAMAQLEEGRPFGEVAREHSQDPPSAERGGEMPHYYGRADATAAVRDDLFRLAVGDLSEPIPISKGYEIFHVLKEVEVSFEEVEEKVLKELQGEALGELHRAYFDELEQRFGLLVEPHGLASLMAILRRGQEGRTFRHSSLEAAEALYSYNGGHVAIGEAVVRSAFLQKGRNTDDSLRVVRALEREVLRPRLLVLRGRQLGIEEEPEIGDWLGRKREEILITEMRQLQIAGGAKATEEEVRQYYEETKGRYRTARQVEVVDVQVSAEGDAVKILRQIAADLGEAGELEELVKRIRKRLQEGDTVGAELEALRQLGDELAVHAWLIERLAGEGSAAVLEEIAGASSARDAVERYIVQQLAVTRSLRPGDGHLHLHRFDAARYGPLVDAAMAAEVGALIGPIEHEGRYSIEKIVAHEKPRIRALDEVAAGVRSALRQRMESELFEDWLVELRATYRDEVRLFAENIEALGSEL